LTYVQGEVADIWKESILKELEAKEREYILVRDFLKDLKMEFGGKMINWQK